MSAANPFRYYMLVRYGDCDQQGVVFNPRYGEYSDLAQMEFLRACLPKPYDPFNGTFEVQTVRQVTEWRAPARFDDLLEIRVTCPRVGTTSFMLHMAIAVLGKSGAFAELPQQIATIETTFVLVDEDTWQKKAIPVAVREGLLAGAAGKSVDHGGFFELAACD